MSDTFTHIFRILPSAQKKIWPALNRTKELGFVLYGGTALALRIGHRQSIDFDFFSDRALNYEAIAHILPIVENAAILQSSDNTYTLSIPIDEDYVKVSFFGGIDFGRVGDPELTEDRNLWVASPEDLMGTKLKVLLQRVEAKDYIDVAALIDNGITLEKGLGSAAALFGKVFSPVDCLRALEYFDDPNLAVLEKSVKTTLKDAVKHVITLGGLPTVRIKSKSLLM